MCRDVSVTPVSVKSGCLLTQLGLDYWHMQIICNVITKSKTGFTVYEVEPEWPLNCPYDTHWWHWWPTIIFPGDKTLGHLGGVYAQLWSRFGVVLPWSVHCRPSPAPPDADTAAPWLWAHLEWYESKAEACYLLRGGLWASNPSCGYWPWPCGNGPMRIFRGAQTTDGYNINAGSICRSAAAGSITC